MTHLHRLILWTSKCVSGPPRLKDSQCRGKKTWIKAFLLKYSLIAGVDNLHNKSQIILITLYYSVIPVHWKNIYCFFQNHNVLKVSTVLQINYQPQLCIFQSKQKPNYIIQILFLYHRSKANSFTNIMPVTYLLLLPKMLSNSLYGHEGRRLQCSFLSFPLEETIFNNNWQQWRVCYANRIPYIKHSKHVASWGYTEVTDNWEGHLPREPTRPEDSSSLMPPGLMATEVSHNVLTFWIIN